MCAPAAVWIAAAVAAAAAHKQANAQNAASEYKGRVDENNAQIADWQAEDAKTRGDLAVDQAARRSNSIEGSQIATLAAKGMDVGYGSPNAMVTDTDYFGQYDQNIARANSRREAWGYGIQASNYRNDEQFLADERKQNNPFVAGAFAFASSFFGNRGGGGPSTTAANTSDYRGSELPYGLRGGGSQENSLLSSSPMVAPRWYGSAYGG